VPLDDEIKLSVDYSPKAVFGGAVSAFWLFLLARTGVAIMTWDRLLKCIVDMQTHGGTFRYLVDGLPGLTGPAIDLGHKIVIRSVPQTGDIIAYLEILGVLKIGGLFARVPPGQELQHVYAYDLVQTSDRSNEFAIAPAVFDAQDWRSVGLGPQDGEQLQTHFLKAFDPLIALYRGPCATLMAAPITRNNPAQSASR